MVAPEQPRRIGVCDPDGNVAHLVVGHHVPLVVDDLHVHAGHRFPHGARTDRNAGVVDQLQVGVRVEARIGVVEHVGGAHQPGRKNHAPRRLGPAGIREGPMHVVRLQVHPVVAGDGMGQPVGLVPRHHLRIGGGARREIDHHRVFRPRGRHVVPDQLVRGLRAGVFVGDPAVVLPADDDEVP